MEDRSFESFVNSVYTANDTILSPRLSFRRTPESAHDVTGCCDKLSWFAAPFWITRVQVLMKKFRYEDCISDDDGPSSVPIIDYGSASVILYSMRSSLCT